MFGKRKANAQLECGIGEAGLRYLLYLPSGYFDTPGKEWPLILYLHGIGERGSNLRQLLKHGIPKIVENQADFSFIAISPQCPKDTFWHEYYDALKAVLEDVIAGYAVDNRRIYLTGNSMGGYGTWGMSIAFPNLFTAIAPICGGGRPEEVCALKDVPVWAFHGDSDDLVQLEEGQKMVDALDECGGRVRFTVYEGVGHDSWTRTYENPDLYAWFLSHQRM